MTYSGYEILVKFTTRPDTELSIQIRIKRTFNPDPDFYENVLYHNIYYISKGLDTNPLLVISNPDPELYIWIRMWQEKKVREAGSPFEIFDI